MRSPFVAAFLAALLLHALGLTLVSLGLQAWQRPAGPSPQEVIAITSVPVPVVPPEPEPEPLTPPVPLIDSMPESLPATPATLAPPPAPEPPPPRQVEARPQPVKPPPVVQHTPPKPPPVRERQARAEPPAPKVRGARPGPAPGALHEPLGSAGAGAPAPAAPESAPPTSQGSAPDLGPLAARSEAPVVSGTGGGGRGGTGAGGEGDGPGMAHAGTGSGSGGGVGPGRGGSGGGGGGGQTSARPLGGYQVKPRYPESARRQGVEGTALLKMRITEHGRVEDVQVERSTGHPDLDQAALEAVRRWRFEPARQRGEPVAVVVTLPVEFRLQ